MLRHFLPPSLRQEELSRRFQTEWSESAGVDDTRMPRAGLPTRYGSLSHAVR